MIQGLVPVLLDTAIFYNDFLIFYFLSGWIRYIEGRREEKIGIMAVDVTTRTLHILITTTACKPLSTIKAVNDPFDLKKPTDTIINATKEL